MAVAWMPGVHPAILLTVCHVATGHAFSYVSRSSNTAGFSRNAPIKLIMMNDGNLNSKSRHRLLLLASSTGYYYWCCCGILRLNFLKGVNKAHAAASAASAQTVTKHSWSTLQALSNSITTRCCFCCCAVYDNANVLQWSTNTAGRGTAPRRFVMQNDGNALIADAANRATWVTYTAGL
jgi:hypothetical protein